jgi:hypothetical protein
MAGVLLLSLTEKPKVISSIRARALLAILVLAASCRSPQNLTLRDTEGREFSARLQDFSVVDLRLSNAPKDANRFEIRRTGRLVAVCPTSTTSSPVAATHCRVLTCGTDSQCPPAHGLKEGTCLNGLCIEPAQNLLADDAIMLCLSGTGADYSSPLQIERFALGLNCGQPCKVPTPCRQP